MSATEDGREPAGHEHIDAASEKGVGGFGDQVPTKLTRDPVAELEALHTEDVDWAQVLQSLQREKKRAKARIEQHYVNRSLFCLESSSTLRENVIKFVEWPIFNGFILLLIGLNCLFLMLEHPLCKCEEDPFCTEFEKYQKILSLGIDCSGWPAVNEMLIIIEVIFTILFTAEMVLLHSISPRTPGLVEPTHLTCRSVPNPPTFTVVTIACGSHVVLSQLLRTFAGTQNYCARIHSTQACVPARQVELV